MLSEGRQSRHDAASLLYLQAEMARQVIHLQGQQREYAGKVASGDQTADYENAVGVCKGAGFVLRQIADGIAWRELDYDRVIIHELAFSPQTGHMHLDSALQELTVAAQHLVDTGDLVLLNDLTNFLRYGDFTSVGAKGVGIHEVKAGTGSKKSGRATRQKKRRTEVIEFLNRGEKMGKFGKQKVIRTKVLPRSYAGDLSAVIAEARSKGQASARFSDCLAVQALDSDIMAERFASGELDLEKVAKNPFSQAKLSMVFNSLSYFDRFTPNAAPYSIFPLSDEDCVDIIMGKIWVFTYFNLGNLVRCLRRRDLLVFLPPEEEIKAAPKLLPGQIAEHELDHPIRVGRPNGPGLLMSFGSLGRIEREFLDEECFADEIEEIVDSQSVEEAIVYSAFEKESLLWD